VYIKKKRKRTRGCRAGAQNHAVFMHAPSALFDTGMGTMGALQTAWASQTWPGRKNG
jgi:hypothetical protein